jgi:hypothetical protein
MKRLLIILVIGFSSLNLFSQKCSIADAENVAMNTISERFAPLNKVNTQYKIESVNTEYYQGEEVFYIFDLSPAGFIIVSAQQSVVPLLAFSTNSSFDIDKNPSAKAWIENYSRQINYNIENNINPSETIAAEWNRLVYAPEYFKSKNGIKTVAPLLTSTWDQGRYYNAHCPVDLAGPDDHVVTGCVATAIGQLMNYFRYPSMGTGSYGYEHPEYGWLEVNFAEQTYNYDQMPLKATDYSDDMARLIYNVGVSVDMNYGPDGSGMYNHKGAYTMRTYFGYNPSTTYLFRDSLPMDFDWTGTLVNHLDQSIPLYYAGWSDYDFIMGHAFILDGYSDDTHYHINWGWGGSSDGYFFIDDLTPGGSDFTLLHEVIVNAVPTDAPQYCSGTKELTNLEGMIEDGSGPLANYQNDTECSWLINPSDSVNALSLEFVKFILDDDDYLIIYDGANDTDPVLLTIYGNEIPTEFESTSDNVLIKFFTNADSVNDGWLLKYTAIKPDYCAVMTNLYDISGTITDGSNSYQYQNNEYCNWKIQPVGMENVLITFEEFDIEPINDFVKILNASNQTAANLSGNTLPEPILIIGNKATITFDSDAGGRAGGFKLHYQTNVTDVKNMNSTQVQVFPNPANDKIIVNFYPATNDATIRIFSIDGKICGTHNIVAGNETDISNLKPGIYILELNNGDSIVRERFVKE